jgi:hypothetical protein
LKKAIVIALAMVLALALSLTGFAAPSLSDLEGHWSQAEVENAIERGFVDGYPDGTFRPDNPITRAEFAKMLCAAWEFAKSADPVPSYNDTSGHWIEDQGWFKPLVDHSIVQQGDGAPSGYFEPDAPAAREDLAVWAIRSLQLEKDPSKYGFPVNFTDKTDIEEAKTPAIGVAVQLGILKGYPDNSFRPKATATRAEAVAIVFRTLTADESLLENDTPGTPPGNSGGSGVPGGGSGDPGGGSGVPGGGTSPTAPSSGASTDDPTDLGFASTRQWKVGDKAVKRVGLRRFRWEDEGGSRVTKEWEKAMFVATLEVKEIMDDGTTMLDLSVSDAHIQGVWISSGPDDWKAVEVDPSITQQVTLTPRGNLGMSGENPVWEKLKACPLNVVTGFLAPGTPEILGNMERDTETDTEWLLGIGVKCPTF